MGVDAFAQMARTLTGVPDRAAAASTVAEGADRLRVAELILRQYGGDDALFVANAIETWLYEGGDLAELLGIKVARGRSRELPHQADAKRRRDQRIGAEFDRLRQSVPGLSNTEAVRLLALALRDPARLAVLREEIGGGAAFPTSEKSLRLILREQRR
jgi:hypothetical protein